jgi:hypothetical protein
VRGTAREPVATALELTAADCETWATLDGEPFVCARRVGAGRVVTLGFYPQPRARRRRRDHGDPPPHARLRVADGVARPRGRGHLDEPGDSASLEEREREVLSAELRGRAASVSVAYAPGARATARRWSR